MDWIAFFGVKMRALCFVIPSTTLRTGLSEAKNLKLA